MTDFIPVNEPSIGYREKELVLQALDSGWISSEGPFVSQFEELLSGRVNRSYGIACSSGTAALDIAVQALGIGPGDEVILPSFTIISCASAIYRTGATPVPVDVHPNLWNITAENIEPAINSNTVAIMMVHIYGLPVDIDPILNLATKYSLAVIEDAAELIGGSYKDKPCGSFGTISTFSFYPNKHITTGEGGMVLTNDHQLATRCQSLRNLCFKPESRFIHEEIGWNYRLTNIQAALGIAQLEKLDQTLLQKAHIGSLYYDLLCSIPDICLPTTTTPYSNNIYWVFGLVLGDSYSINVADIMSELRKLHVGSRPFFYPIHLQPVFTKLGLFKNISLPVSEKLATNGFYIPSGVTLSDSDIFEVSTKLSSILSKYHS